MSSRVWVFPLIGFALLQCFLFFGGGRRLVENWGVIFLTFSFCSVPSSGIDLFSTCLSWWILGTTIGVRCCSIQLWFSAVCWYFSACLELRKVQLLALWTVGLIFISDLNLIWMFTMVLVCIIRPENLNSNTNRESGIHFCVVHLLRDSRLLWLYVYHNRFCTL